MKDFNIIINGVGGQGLITLLQIISRAALEEGYNIKTSELHGLSQRGGSVEVHIRLGKKVWSPLISQGKANLVISLETQEVLNSLFYSSKETVFLINQHKTLTLLKDFSEKEVLNILKKLSLDKVFLVHALTICQEELKTDVVAGVYLLGYAFSKNLLPLKMSSLTSAIKKVIPERYLELNMKAFELAQKS